VGSATCASPSGDRVIEDSLSPRNDMIIRQIGFTQIISSDSLKRAQSAGTICISCILSCKSEKIGLKGGRMVENGVVWSDILKGP